MAAGAGAAWRDGAARRAAIDAFAGVDASDSDAAAEAARRLLSDGDWTGALIAPLVAALAADPWFDPPLRVHRDGARIGAVLVETPAATIAAAILSADALAAAPVPATVVAPGRVSVTRYHRAGGAILERWAVPPVGPTFRSADAGIAVPRLPHRLADGEVIVHDGRVEAHRLAAARTDVASVTATLRFGAAPVARAYAVGDGALVHAAETDVAQARTAMLLTLLRVSGRADAREAFDAATRDGGFHLRWAAMREWLALDLRGALPRLRAMADDPHPDVAAAARRTLEAAQEAACRA